MKKAAKPQWLDRRISAPGPHLCLCLTEAEFHKACKHIKSNARPSWLNFGADATLHTFERDGKTCCVVCLQATRDRSAIEIAGLLIHESVHVWQSYADGIGESNPGDEQEAYAIQSIAQELLAEYARRLPKQKKGKS